MRYDIWQTEREKAEELPCGLKILKGTSMRNGKPTLKVWRPKATKPHINYYYPTEQARDNAVDIEVESFVKHQTRVQERKAERAGTEENLDAVKVGDIFHWSWGYEQTNVDYYQVIEKRGRQLTLREIGQKTVPGSEVSHGMADMRLAVKDHFIVGKAPFKKLLQFSGGKPYIRMASYGWCDLWDGRANYCSWYA